MVFLDNKSYLWDMLSPFLILIAVIILCSVILNNASSKLGVPVLLAFMLLGMLFGTSGLFPVRIPSYGAVEQLCSGALVLIMFYGGYGTNWKSARPVIAEASVLASAGVALTAGFTGLFCRFALGWEWVESFLMGSVVASTDAASVFSILRGKRLGLKGGTAPLLEVESGSNDPMSYLLTVVMVSLMGGSASGWGILGMLAMQVLVGAGMGFAIAWLAYWFIKHVGIESSGFASLFFLAVALLSYAVPDMLGGNGYLSAYIVGIILGNVHYPGKKELVHFFDGVGDLMQVLIFFTLGLLAHPSGIGNEVGPSAAIFVFMLVAARPLAVFMLLAPFRGRYSAAQKILISFAGLRGASSIVFAIVATVGVSALGGTGTPGLSGSPALSHDIFNIVFGIVLLSISIQGWLLPFVARRLGQIDSGMDVMKTFSDFSEETDLQFSEITIDGSSPWVGQTVAGLRLPRKILLCRVRRSTGEIVVPKGNTVLLEGDRVMICTMAYRGSGQVRLVERSVSAGGKFDGKTVVELPFSENEQLVLIRRGGEDVIPHGATRLLPGDVLILNRGA